ncbi:MAG TPA: DUF2252 family protein [Acidobacteriaceae bacterium]|nr:DUF2252 family protein [Acidobacteriaceae bacterium]
MSKVVMVGPGERAKVLEATRRAKMASSAHAYVRGNTRQFYEWLLTDSGKRVPQGPPVWICGDCHVGNLGPLASADGRIAIQIRDLDQTVIGNPAHDLIRLALSLAMAARGSALPGVTTALMMEQMIEGYEQSLVAPKRKVKVEGDELGPIRKVLDEAYRRKWKHLAQERIEDVRPEIPLGKRFWTLTEEEKDGIAKLFAGEATVAKVLQLKGREPGTKLKVLDAAYWMKGCSSLGRVRYAVLLGVGGKGAGDKKDGVRDQKDKDRQYCLIDLKEATAAAAPKLKDAPGGHADRVVAGACHLSPYLGERMLAVTLGRRPIVMRELMPQDLKFDLERLTRDEAIAAARYLAEVVGKAHGRQMTHGVSRSWRAELNRNRAKNLDAPGWLWSSVVSLIGEHEVGYLEHSRRYALGA